MESREEKHKADRLGTYFCYQGLRILLCQGRDSLRNFRFARGTCPASWKTLLHIPLTSSTPGDFYQRRMLIYQPSAKLHRRSLGDQHAGNLIGNAGELHCARGRDGSDEPNLRIGVRVSSVALRGWLGGGRCGASADGTVGLKD